MEIDLFTQRCIMWFAIWLGGTIWALIGLQFRKEKIVKEIKYKEIEVPKVVKIEVPMLPKRIEVRREVR